MNESVKLFRARRANGLQNAAAFQTKWFNDVANPLCRDVPADLRALRATASFALRFGRGRAAYDLVDILWFRDQAHATQHEDWRVASGVNEAEESLCSHDSGVTILASEHVIRGEHYLRSAWSQRDLVSIKAISFLTRRRDFSRNEFAHYWRHKHAPIGTRAIPADAQGFAYVQNYAIGEDGEFDGVAEGFVGGFPGLGARSEFFRSAEAAPVLDDEFNFLDVARRPVVIAEESVYLAPS